MWKESDKIEFYHKRMLNFVKWFFFPQLLEWSHDFYPSVCQYNIMYDWLALQEYLLKGEGSSQHPDACKLEAILSDRGCTTSRKIPSRKDWALGALACCLCTEPWGHSSWACFHTQEQLHLCLLQSCGTHKQILLLFRAGWPGSPPLGWWLKDQTSE